MPHNRKTNILVVDDYPENINALSNLIASDDVEVHAFLKVDKALEALTQHDFGLAILDVQMPEMSGFEMAKLIRGVKRYAHMPIIFVTAQQNDNRTVLLGYETGAVDLLFKPLDPHIVRGKVRVFVELHRQRLQMQDQLEELQKLRIAAEAANVAKSLFLANMSHEIRTPLASVMGFADLIAKGEVPPDELDSCAASIRRNGNLLLRLIDDILDLSKIEANRLEMEMIDSCLTDFLQDIDSTLSFKAREKGISLRFVKPDKIEHGHVFDPIRLKQIFLNIIGNAIKFTHKGEIVVTFNVNAESPTHDRLSVTVKDPGVGISRESIDRLFHPFGQADASVKREFGGSGLGLIISRQLAQAMNGDIRILESEVGKGSTFLIEVVLERSQKSEMTLLPRQKSSFEAEIVELNLSDKKILAVDDARDNLVLLEMFLRNTKAQLTYAHNGLEAVEACRKDSFNIILMDIQMPKMDGHEATAEIRRMGIQAPIVALTAHATRSEYEKCRQAGCNDALIKPVSKNNLIEMLRNSLNLE